MSEISLTLPVDLEEEEIKIVLAAGLYENQTLTLKQAAEFADLSMSEFLKELGEREKNFTNISREELEDELSRL